MANATQNKIDSLTRKANAMVKAATDEQLDMMWNLDDLDARILKIVSAEITRRAVAGTRAHEILRDIRNAK